MGYSDFLIFLLFVVLLGVVVFAFTMGYLARGSRVKSPQKPKPRNRAKKKDETSSSSPQKDENPKSKDGKCKLPNGYVGMLKKLNPDERAYNEVCPFTNPIKGCPFFLKCIGVSKK